jgi:hypothetical protein
MSLLLHDYLHEFLRLAFRKARVNRRADAAGRLTSLDNPNTKLDSSHNAPQPLFHAAGCVPRWNIRGYIAERKSFFMVAKPSGNFLLTQSSHEALLQEKV